MVPVNASNLTWLRPIHLFSGFTDAELGRVLEMCQERVYQAGERIIVQDAPVEGFYFVRSGGVRLYHTTRRGKTISLGTLGPRGYFDTEGVLSRRKRHLITVEALRPTHIYFIPLEAFLELLKAHNSLKIFLELVAQSQGRARKHRPSWLAPEETIFLYLTKHWGQLVGQMLLPGFLLGLSALAFGVAFWLQLIFPAAFGTLPFILGAAIAIWRWVDWRNDFYLVTNRRVVWVEKVVLLYESRREAPLRTILSVSVYKDLYGQALGYGDVVIRTFTGQVTFRFVESPDHVQTILQDFWQREKTHQRVQEQREMAKLLRQRLGLEPPEPTSEPPLTLRDERAARRARWAKVLRSWFADRIEEGSTIIYRKHWFLLLRRTWWLILGLLVLLAGDLAYFVDNLFQQPNEAPPIFTPTTVIVVTAMLGFVGFGALIYQFWDWQNDIYMLTPDQIMDIERKPLGSESKQAAPLESIQTLDYTREGLLGLLLNYGNVNIRAGTNTLIFRGVHAPDLVQQEIFRRLEERMRIKQAAQARQERERVVEWLAVYHEAVHKPQPDEEEDWWAESEENGV